MLARVGTDSREALQKLGAVRAYQVVRAADARPRLTLLWAIEGALTDRDGQDIARTERDRLLFALDDVQRASPSRSAP